MSKIKDTSNLRVLEFPGANVRAFVEQHRQGLSPSDNQEGQMDGQPADKSTWGKGDFPAAVLQSTPDGVTHFAVWCDPSLGDNGPILAAGILETCEQDYTKLQSYFKDNKKRHFDIILAPDINGAYHNGCTSTEIYCNGNASGIARVNQSRMAAMAEVIEVLGCPRWDCGTNVGEGLSMVLAAELYPDTSSAAFAAKQWLESERIDFVGTATIGNDHNLEANGCVVLFLNYLRYQLGIPWDEIIAGGAPTLAQTILKVKSSKKPKKEFETFKSLLATRFPVGAMALLDSGNVFPITDKPIKPANNLGKQPALSARSDAARASGISNILAKYSFKGSMLDESGHENNPITPWPFRFGYDRFNSFHSALVLDGNKSIEIPASASLNIPSKGGDLSVTFTVSAWIKTRDTSESGIVCKGPGTTNVFGYSFVLKKGRPCATITGQNVRIELTGPDIVTNNRWHYLVMTYSPKKSQFYVDARLAAEQENPGIKSEPLNQAPLLIGASSDTDHKFHGLLDDLMIEGVVVTEGEIARRYGRKHIGVHTLSDLPPGMTQDDIEHEEYRQLLGICKPSGGATFACGVKGIIKKSTNDGASWSTLVPDSGASNSLCGIAFADNNHGVVIGDRGTIYWTDNGGTGATNWHPPVTFDRSNTPQPFDIAYVADDLFVMVGCQGPSGEDGFVAISVDYGKNWTLITSADMENEAEPFPGLWSIYSATNPSNSKTYCWIGGDDGALWRLDPTEDPTTAAAWEDESISGVHAPITCLYFLKYNNSFWGIAETRDGQIFRYSESISHVGSWTRDTYPYTPTSWMLALVLTTDITGGLVSYAIFNAMTPGNGFIRWKQGSGSWTSFSIPNPIANPQWVCMAEGNTSAFALVSHSTGNPIQHL